VKSIEKNKERSMGIKTNWRSLFSISQRDPYSYHEALENIDKAIELRPAISGAWYIKYRLLEALKRDEEAKAALDKWGSLEHELGLSASSKNWSCRRVTEKRLQEAFPTTAEILYLLLLNSETFFSDPHTRPIKLHAFYGDWPVLADRPWRAMKGEISQASLSA